MAKPQPKPERKPTRKEVKKMKEFSDPAKTTENNRHHASLDRARREIAKRGNPNHTIYLNES